MHQSSNYTNVQAYSETNSHFVMSIRFLMRYSPASVLSSTLYVRTTVNGQRAPEKSLNIKLLKSDWDSSGQNVKTTCTQSNVHNARLNQIRTRFYDAFLQLQQSGEVITARKVQERAFGEKKGFHTLNDAFKRYIIEKQITTNISRSTLEIYAKYYKNISHFLSQNGHKNILLHDITENHMLDMLNFFKGKYAHDYAVKTTQYFRSIVSFAFSKGMIDKNKLTSIRLEKSGDYDTTHLTQDQVKKIAQFDFSNLQIAEESKIALSEERDALIFTCYTGLHHSDYSEATFDLKEYNGRVWLTGCRIKSKGGRKDKPYSIPLHPLALAVIAKYGGIRNLPKRSNKQRNLILKSIAMYTSTNLILTTKIARKTLADYCLNTLKMRQEVVASILGHTSTKFIKHYAAISNQSIDDEMQFEV